MVARANAAQRRMYARFADEFPSCWSCGWEPSHCDSTGRRLRVENAHIVGGPGRRHDRRAIVRLCSLCHRLAHGERIVVDGEAMKVLALANLLWLKKRFDASWYDAKYLQSLGQEGERDTGRPRRTRRAGVRWLSRQLRGS